MRRGKEYKKVELFGILDTHTHTLSLVTKPCTFFILLNRIKTINILVFLAPHPGVLSITWRSRQVGVIKLITVPGGFTPG